MKIHNENEFTKGWFIGSFRPTLLNTGEFEVAFKRYKKGDSEDKHFHKIATEYTVIGSGLFIMNGKTLKSGDIIVLDPGEVSEFKCLKDGVNFVIKTPSVVGDKYLIEK